MINYGHQPLVQLAGGRIYSSAGGEILDQATGAVVLSGNDAWGVVGAAGPFAVEADGARLSIVRY